MALGGTTTQPPPCPARGLAAIRLFVGAPSDLGPTKCTPHPGAAQGRPCPGDGSLSPTPSALLSPWEAAGPGMGPSLPTPNRFHGAPGYSRAAGSSLGDSPSRLMSLSSMAGLTARLRRARTPGAGVGVTSLWGPRGRAAGERTVPLLSRGRTRSRARAGAKLGRPGAPRHSSRSAFWAGGPGPASRPPGAYLQTPSPRPAPPSANRLPRGHPDTGRAQGTLETNSLCTRSAGPARPPPSLRGRVSTGSGPSYQSRRPGGPGWPGEECPSARPPGKGAPWGSGGGINPDPERHSVGRYCG